MHLRIVGFVLLFFSSISVSYVYAQCDQTSAGGGEFTTVFTGIVDGDELCIEDGDVVTITDTGVGGIDLSAIAVTITIQGTGELRLVATGAFDVAGLLLGSGSEITLESSSSTITSTSNNIFGDANFINIGGFAGSFFSTLLGSSNPLTGPITFDENSGVLPITLTYFKGNSTENEVNLKWQTSYEENFSHFEIERSLDGRKYQLIGKDNSKGGLNELTSYSYTDFLPVKGNNYYRLKAVDYDGTYEYSSVVNIWYEGYANDITVYPNPVPNRSFKVNLNFVPESEITIEIFNDRGDFIQKYKTGNYSSELTLPKNIKDGTYILKLYTDDQLFVKRLMVR